MSITIKKKNKSLDILTVQGDGDLHLSFKNDSLINHDNPNNPKSSRSSNLKQSFDQKEGQVVKQVVCEGV